MVGMALGALLWVLLLGEGWVGGTQRGSNLNHSVTLWFCDIWTHFAISSSSELCSHLTDSLHCQTLWPPQKSLSYFLCILGKQSEGSLFVIICFCLQILAEFSLTTINWCPFSPFFFFPPNDITAIKHTGVNFTRPFIHSMGGWRQRPHCSTTPQAHINGAHKTHPVVSSGLIVKWFPDLKLPRRIF